MKEAGFSGLPWRGWWRHLRLTLALNFRSRQPLIYGYLVPVFFLLAFGSVFRADTPPLLHQMGSLLTITILGGACFGMPTAMVAERERGIWRRYRLLPSASTGIVLSTVAARTVLLLSGVAMQIALARAIYHTPWPAYPAHLTVAFGLAAFAFLGLGLLIAMLADSVPAVQALGQAVFLPMIMVGGVGVPLGALPPWAQHVASFLPGRYAAEALQACVAPEGGGLAEARFALGALGTIGAAGFVAAAGLFRWEAGTRPLTWRARGWITLALGAWMAVGLAAEAWSMHRPSAPGKVQASFGAVVPTPSWGSLGEGELAAIPFDDLPPDDGNVLPLAREANNPAEPDMTRLGGIRSKLARWEPGRASGPVQRLRNLLSVCAVADLMMDPDEAEIARAVFDQIRTTVPDRQIRRQLAGWLVLHPGEGTVLVKVPEFDFEGTAEEPLVRERCAGYAKKLLREAGSERSP